MPGPISRTQTAPLDGTLAVPLLRQVSAASSFGPSSQTSASSSIPLLQDLASNNHAIPATIQSGCADGNSSPGNTQTLSSHVPTTLNTLDGTQSHRNGIGPNPLSSPTTNQSIIVPRNKDFKEWRSWKIHWLYMALLLLIVIFFIITISTLTVISRRDSGFARESQPPGFLQRNPELRKAIWEQGIFYTAIPAFIMTIYRTMWDASVMAFADRQPWIIAFRNKHFLPSACMLSSLVLSFGIVPLTSFLFRMDSSLSNSTFPLSIDTYYNGTIEPQIPAFRNEPSVRMALDTAAGLHLHNLSLPPRTDGTFAFPQFTPRVDLGISNIRLKIAAYGVNGDCIEIPESEYEKKTQRLGSSTISIQVSAIDRMCAISNAINIRTNPWSPDIFMTSWYTPTCSTAALTRLSVLAARYDKASQTIQTLSLLSCKTSYFVSSGELVASSGPGMGYSSLSFEEDRENRAELDWLQIYPLRNFLEKEVHNLRYFDGGETIDGNEFVKYVYRMAQQASPDEPMRPEALVNSTQILFETVYAVFASIYSFKDRNTPLNETGIYMIEEKRLFVVPVVAYVLLGVLGTTQRSQPA
ncbi:uncharacterized protein BDR25DRAFT_386341 [Lindgomyces ingoldianus]|uniref:Uncharacterized protein n=1 Tax=Lindgomyces ingoldianus TaxID=673940 RepID=A0ACB6R443_9PLEO|nr:uncharacterized protein BDR25DRAFT_386341 [Lindgomyces ingoldianus]KAF2473545.1 hypothetical protein BDR25DRAFT_386341 [Lindgomyces ingoldianus]